jgi:hypothetical protein
LKLVAVELQHITIRELAALVAIQYFQQLHQMVVAVVAVGLVTLRQLLEQMVDQVAVAVLLVMVRAAETQEQPHLQDKETTAVVEFIAGAVLQVLAVVVLVQQVKMAQRQVQLVVASVAMVQLHQ